MLFDGLEATIGDCRADAAFLVKLDLFVGGEEGDKVPCVPIDLPKGNVRKFLNDLIGFGHQKCAASAAEALIGKVVENQEEIVGAYGFGAGIGELFEVR